MKFTWRNPHFLRSGFALVVTLSMMILLVVVAVGLLGLSTIALRTSTVSSAEDRARSNARMALMMAIDRLQTEMGPDQRISANSSILSTASVPNPKWVGVWNSWQATAGRSGHSTIEGTNDTEMHPTYEDGRENYFRSWLVSLPYDQMTNIDAAQATLNASRMPTDEHDAAILVGEGTLGDNFVETDQVEASLIGVNNDAGVTTGRYSWWVGDESQKAALMADSYVSNSPNNDAEKIYRSQAPGSTGTTAIAGLEGLTDDTQLGTLPSLETLDLVDANREETDLRKPADAYHAITPHSYSVLADVREGGLKRDLSTILEQPIDRANDGPEYMLYEYDDPRFTDRAHSRVPIQDLAAYYQLYDNESTFANGRREGVQYSSAGLPNAIQIKVPNFDGGNKNRQRILREYTALYRQPVITKVQFLVAVTAQPITAEERQSIIDEINNPNTSNLTLNNLEPVRDTDTHKLRMGIIPMITLWNPNNLPLVLDSSQIMRFSTPPFGFRFRKFRSLGAPSVYDYRWTNLSYNSGNNFGGATTGSSSGNSLLRLRFGANSTANTVFQPGEVKVFSLPASTGSNLMDNGNAISLISTDTNFDVANEWDPFGFFMIPNSTSHGPYSSESPEAYGFRFVEHPGQSLVFNPNDRITFSIDAEDPGAVANGDWRDGRYISQARSSDPKGSGFTLYFMDEGFQSNWRDDLDHIRHYTMVGRHGTNTSNIRAEVATFNRDLITPGFPGGQVPIAFQDEANSLPCSQIISASSAGEVITLFEFSLHLGCEVGSAGAGGFGGGRRITSRPFLHSPLSAAPFFDQSDSASLYDYGWDWMVGTVNTVEDSILQAKPNTNNGYYGGGYTIEQGTTHVVQREIPVIPPISIASLSHAQLGGFSLGYAMSVGNNPDSDTYFKRAAGLQNTEGLEYQRTTAFGQAGLAPHIQQAIGNSYAHPNMPADKAFILKERHFDADEGPVDVPFVDHSYLANKALWDEFFFSSIAPQPAKVPLFGGTARTAKEVADDFFQVSDSSTSRPLPNRRIQPYKTRLDQDKLDALFDEADQFTDGLADKIASHLMVQGGFNINSTSVNAWRIFLSSLKGKPVAYLESGLAPEEATPEGTTVSASGLPNTEPIQSADISSPNSPPEQWTSGRELTDDEISELATAIVKQVKLRGPFLSLSEFVNRRLESGNPELSKMGALQAALNDNDVSINANFRQANRMMNAEAASIPFAFPQAAQGPIAYGSTAYVDQADILRSFAGQLTPRGDTFVIRAYGDSLSATGQVEARAWCEAVIQRVPEYLDASDEPQVKTGSLNVTNQTFGRKFLIKSFRWLNSSEV